MADPQTTKEMLLATFEDGNDYLVSLDTEKASIAYENIGKTAIVG